jgi:chromosome segregation ATPase
MRVSRIEVFGFKSFMERLSLPLTSGVTGVVGPNGCGKSNIVDALRWVLGETRARNLRGAIAEDVIFNGTEKLRPLGLAEVTITLKAAKDNFFDELSSPALEAAQVEELLASGNDVEIALKHIQENDEVGSAEVTESVAADSVAADDVAQESPPTRDANGRPILRVISGSKDVLEESSAAGETICLRRSESESSEAKAAQPKPSEALLGRFAWLQSVSEVQVTRRLYRSGESEYFINRVACRLKDIVDFLRVVGLGPRSYTIVAQGEVSRIITSKPEERRQILEEAAGVLGFKDRIAAATRRLEETDVNIARIDDILKEVTRQVASLKRQAAKARNRAQLKEQVVTLEKQLAIDRSVRLRERGEELRKGLVELQANETNLDAELQKVQAEEQEFRGELMTIDVERDGLRTKIDAFKEELYAINQRRSQQRARVSELQALQRAAQTEIERLRERGTVLVNRKEQAGETLTTLQKHESEILEQISALEVTSDDDLKRVAAELTTWRDRLRAKEREFSGVREEIARAESTLEALRNQFRAASPAAQLKKTIGDQANQLASKAIGILVEGLTVPEDLTRAVQAVLAERAAFLVAENPKEIAESFISTIANNQDHAKKAPALGVFQAGEDTPLAITLPNGWELPALLSRIEVAPPYRIAAQHVLGRVFLAIDMQQAFAALALAKTHGITDLTIVTAAGDLLDSASFYSFRHEGGLVALQGKIQEISNLLEQQRFELGECEAEREQMSGMIGEREREHARLLQESQERARKLKELSQARGNAAGRLQTEKRMLEQLDSDLQRAERQTEEVRQRIAKLKGEEEEMTVQLANTGEEREGEIREQLQGLQSSAQDLDRKRQLSMERLSSMRQRLDTARRAVDSVRSHISTQTLDMQKATLEMQALKERLEGGIG